MKDFKSLGISEEIISRLQKNNVTTPTPIQEKAIPSVMEHKDVIAQAQTGTGKTLAFILPVIEKFDFDNQSIQALIVTPTRELALQITEEVRKLIRHIEGISVLPVYGGQDVDKQLSKLRKNVGIVVGTPGRILDHIGRGTIDLSKIDTLVLDEADQMLHIGFLKEVEMIIKETPATRQTLLFSATIPDEIKVLSKKHMKNPQYISVERTQGPAKSVKQLAVFVNDREKQSTLIDMIKEKQPYLAVIFCRTKRRVSKLYGELVSYGFSCDELHGDLSQAKREKVMKRFREAEFQLLIATDVAARGLDVEGVTHVFNYDIPEDADSYVHRIGRTGRAGETGLAVTFYSPAQKDDLAQIEKDLNIKLSKHTIGNVTERDSKPKQRSARKPSSGRERKPKEKQAGGSRNNSEDRSRSRNSRGTKPAASDNSRSSKPAKSSSSKGRMRSNVLEAKEVSRGSLHKFADKSSKGGKPRSTNSSRGKADGRPARGSSTGRNQRKK
ncbi:DEAD/DEAH box helicase [Rossellomorea vietnamensis]|uniref:RNA helicase n=2 Tax=Rossellomorea TaxID=2837508 RepID=A0A5D4KD45_9BACI|nr:MULTISPECIES: DEAD/DEAH box helicase [Rossellomorea]TYR75112.1 DEAD/DEAH box helicase [Rossellomorea vietnamensis]TYS79868.1 DEAD/DEAH box helicase [Rossellomorea aquimaris]